MAEKKTKDKTKRQTGKQAKRSMSELAKLEQEARDRGLHYGQYVGILEQRKEWNG